MLIPLQDWSPRFLVYGDLGLTEENSSFSRLEEEVATGRYDAVLHVGDFAYDMHHNDGQVG